MEKRIVKVKDICEIKRWKAISKSSLLKEWLYPVYSSATLNNWCIGYLNTYDYEGEYITWTGVWIYAWTCFYRKWKFSVTQNAWVLKIKDKNINIKYLTFLLNIEAKKNIDPLLKNKMLNTEDMKEIELELPSKEEQDRIVNFLEPMSESKDWIIWILTQEINLLDKKIQYYKNKLLHI